MLCSLVRCILREYLLGHLGFLPRHMLGRAQCIITIFSPTSVQRRPRRQYPLHLGCRLNKKKMTSVHSLSTSVDSISPPRYQRGTEVSFAFTAAALLASVRRHKPNQSHLGRNSLDRHHKNSLGCKSNSTSADTTRDLVVHLHHLGYKGSSPCHSLPPRFYLEPNRSRIPSPRRRDSSRSPQRRCCTCSPRRQSCVPPRLRRSISSLHHLGSALLTSQPQRRR